MVKIRLAEEEIENVKQQIRDKGWNIDRNTTEVLPEANKARFEKILKEKNINPQNLRVHEFKSLVKEDKIFTPQAENRVRDFIFEYPQNNQAINLNDILNLFEYDDVRIKQITHRSYKDFMEGKEIEKFAFEAFCTAIGIEWCSVVHKDSIYFQDYSLDESLRFFNHQQQINFIKKNLAINHTRAFLAANPCQYSRTWMLRRLEAEICRMTKLKCKSITLTNSSYVSFNISNLKTHFNKEKLNYLDRENIFLILDIKDYEPQIVTEIILRYWQPLVLDLPKKYKGQLILFLLTNNCNNQFNDIENYLSTLPLANYETQDIASLLDEIVIKSGQPLSGDTINIVNQIIQNSENNSDNKAHKLLLDIYKSFKVSKKTPQSLLSLWEKYP